MPISNAETIRLAKDFPQLIGNKRCKICGKQFGENRTVRSLTCSAQCSWENQARNRRASQKKRYHRIKKEAAEK